MAKNLIKSDSLGFEPAEFEDLSPESRSGVIRAYKHGRKSNEEVAEHPLAKNLIPKSKAEINAQSVEVCVDPFFDNAASPSEQNPADKSPDDPIAPEELVEIKAEWDEAWQTKLDDALEKARSEAYDRGYAEAREALTQEVNAEKAQFTDALKNLQNTWESFIKRSETLLLEISIEIGHFLLDAPLPERFSRATESALLEALENLSREVPVRLSLNPVDLLRLQESGLTGHIEDQFVTLRWDPQPTLKEGNWIIQTPRQAIRRVSEELLANLRDRFGLHENTQSDLMPREKPENQEDQQIPPVNNIAVSTTTMTNQQELDLSSTMPFTTATSTAPSKPQPDLSPPASVTGQKD